MDLLYLVGGDHPFVPMAALFQDTLLSLVINIRDAEAPAVAKRPLKIIEQGPDRVAAQWNALAERLGGCVERIRDLRALC